MAKKFWLLVFACNLALFYACSSNRSLTVVPPDADVEETTEEENGESAATFEEAFSELKKLQDDARRLRKNGESAEAQELLEQALNLIAANELENLELYENHIEYHTLTESILEDYKSLMSMRSPLERVTRDQEGLEFGWYDDRGSAKSQKQAGSLPPIPIVENELVRTWIRFFSETRRGRKTFEAWLERGSRYRPMIEQALREQDLPQELYFLSMIESGFNPIARSSAKAVGHWQFIYGTGRLYDLEMNYYVDERQDPEKSARAAARHIRDLYERHKDWYIALSTYNCSEGRVYREIARRKSNNYWELKGLPRQTREYVPKFLAAVIIGKSPQKFGFTDVKFFEPVKSEIVTVKGCVDLSVLADCAGTSYANLRLLNPELHHGFTPPFDEGYQMRIPAGAREKFTLAYAKLPESAKAKRAIHVVRRGETLSQIARRYASDVSQLVALNRLRSANSLSIGQQLFVPVTKASRYQDEASQAVAVRKSAPPSPVPNASRSKQTALSNSGADENTAARIEYTVRKGDTIGRIAQTYGVQIRSIREWNNLRYGQYIYPGQVLIVHSNSSRVIDSGDGSAAVAAELEPRASDADDKVYVVRKGDTLWTISRVFGVPLEMILNANRMKKHTVIKPGDRVLIPG